jgi:hypothetical protein
LSPRQGQNIQLFLYKNFVENPKVESIRLMDLFGISIAETDVDCALDLSSKEKMRRSEELHRATYIVKSGDKSFVRKDNAARGESLAEEDKDFIQRKTAEITNLLGCSN